MLAHLYKKNFPRMVTALAKYTGLKDLATVEDIVQEAFTEASEQWKSEIPDHPEAWLFRVCRNIAFKKIRDASRWESRSLESENSLRYQIDHLFDETEADDDWRMLLACLHPDFAPKSQVVFALRYLAGFRIDQIAAVLGSSPETITKSLYRMRESISRENISFNTTIVPLSPERSAVVLKILYLMFNEGYRTSSGKSILNHQLCEDALSLTLTIVRSAKLKSPDAHALLALILFNLSRFEARFNEHGELLDLEHQDRTRWSKDLIQVGTYHLGLGQSETPSTYHLEAAIAWLHCSAPNFQQTDWSKISVLYEKLLMINNSPFTKMNQAIALFYNNNRKDALSILEALGQSAFMQRYYPYHVTLGKIHAHQGETVLAIRHFEKALALTEHEAEKTFIRKLLNTSATPL